MEKRGLVYETVQNNLSGIYFFKQQFCEKLKKIGPVGLDLALALGYTTYIDSRQEFCLNHIFGFWAFPTKSLVVKFIAQFVQVL